MKKTFKRAAVALAVVATTAVAAVAHHSNAMFDYEQTREISGTVTGFLWTNPHSYLELEVTSSSGNAQPWTVEFQGINNLVSRGLSLESFKPGDEVTVVIHPLKNGTTGGDFLSAVLADGTEIHSEES